jgi:hypothetical protein
MFPVTVSDKLGGAALPFLLAPIDASLPPVREALVRVREEEEWLLRLAD